jgi:NAD(P)-dependent dehydrogenase (short-subunit alcohol dehydrogenase family)
MPELDGTIALVTGGSRGIGATIALALAKAGADVAVNYQSRAAEAEAVAEAIRRVGRRALTIAADVSDGSAVRHMMDRVASSLGPIDILVNNAGNGGAEGMGLVQFRDSDPSGWMGAINVNLFGVLHCSRAVINGMCERGFGRVITISSGAGITGLRIGVSPYAAGKGGAIAFMRHLAMENARDGVTANSLALGLMQPENSGPVDALAKQIPVGRTGTPEDIGSACVYLASDEASWVTGQTIHIDGGATFG